MRITLNDISKKYSDNWIFQHVNVSFESGNVYPIIGSNGSGKSTLLQIISGFVTPNEGTVKYHIEDRDISIEDWYKHLSIAAPYLDLFEEFSVEESVNLHSQLKLLSISNSDLIKVIELEDHRTKTLKQLSSGMRQRLKLALAIYSNTHILLLDEPSSNLDKKWTDWLNQALAKTMTNRIVIICSNSQSEELRHANQSALDLSSTSYR